MINEKFYDEIKENLIQNINDSFTLNLAISLLEDSKKYKVDSEYYKQALNEIKKYITKDIQKCTYGQVSKYQDVLQIIDKFLGVDDNE